MAVGIENFTNIDTSNPTAYPKGNLQDDAAGVNGTPLNVATLGDIFQTFAKLLDAAGITANGTPDNVTNGYQYFDAMQALFGTTAWTAGAAPSFTVNNPPLGSVTAGSVVVNRYKMIGKTFYWHLRVTALTIAGAPTSIYVSGPISGQAYKNTNCRFVGLYNDVSNLIVTTTGPTAPMQVTLTLSGGSAFTNGTTNQNIDLWFVTELN